MNTQTAPLILTAQDLSERLDDEDPDGLPGYDAYDWANER